MASTRTIYAQKADEARATGRVLGLPRWAVEIIPTLTPGIAVWDVNGNVQVVKHLITESERPLVFTDRAMTEDRPSPVRRWPPRRRPRSERPAAVESRRARGGRLRRSVVRLHGGLTWRPGAVRRGGPAEHGHGRQPAPQGGIPDGLLVGFLAFLLGLTVLVWTATGLAGALRPRRLAGRRAPSSARPWPSAPSGRAAARPRRPPGRTHPASQLSGLRAVLGHLHQRADGADRADGLRDRHGDPLPRRCAPSAAPPGRGVGGDGRGRRPGAADGTGTERVPAPRTPLSARTRDQARPASRGQRDPSQGRRAPRRPPASGPGPPARSRRTGHALGDAPGTAARSRPPHRRPRTAPAEAAATAPPTGRSTVARTRTGTGPVSAAAAAPAARLGRCGRRRTGAQPRARARRPGLFRRRANRPGTRVLFGAERGEAATQAILRRVGPVLVVTSDPALWPRPRTPAPSSARSTSSTRRTSSTPPPGCAGHPRPAAGPRPRPPAPPPSWPPYAPRTRGPALAEAAETMLRCWLHAAAVDGRPFRHVHRWARAARRTSRYGSCARTPRRRPARRGELEAILTAHPERRDPAQDLTARALGALSSIHIRDACNPGRADALALESFIA